MQPCPQPLPDDSAVLVNQSTLKQLSEPARRRQLHAFKICKKFQVGSAAPACPPSRERPRHRCPRRSAGRPALTPLCPQPLLFADLLDERCLVTVERPALDISAQLPPPVQQKKFGT